MVRKRKDAGLLLFIGEVRKLHQEGKHLAVKHVKAHRTKKAKHDMSHSERFITEGNEKADERAKIGTMLDGSYMAQIGVCAVQQKREVFFCAA